jgi:hypothetical protein
MNSETTFTASSGHRCTYEVFIEDGKASATIVWLGQPPTPEDIRELEKFLVDQADRAQFPHSGAENYFLGKIEREDLPRLREIVAERAREIEEHDHDL